MNPTWNWWQRRPNSSDSWSPWNFRSGRRDSWVSGRRDSWVWPFQAGEASERSGDMLSLRRGDSNGDLSDSNGDLSRWSYDHMSSFGSSRSAGDSSGEDITHPLTDVRTRAFYVFSDTNSRKRVLFCFPGGWVFVPRNNKCLDRWEMAVCWCTIFTAFWTPYAVALGLDSLKSHAIDFLQSIIFAGDMVVHFFMAIPVVLGQGDQKAQKKTWCDFSHKPQPSPFWQKDPDIIAANYLQGWFFFDLLTVCPFDEIWHLAIILTVGQPEGVDGRKSQMFSMLRLMQRMLRLLRLLRLARVAAALERLQLAAGMCYGKMDLIRLLFLVMLVLHCIACLWAGLGRNGYELRAMGLLPEQHECLDHEGDTHCFTWLEHKDQDGSSSSEPDWKIYLISFYWAVTTLATIGYGDICPRTQVEFVACILIMGVGSSLWAYCIGAVFSSVSAMNQSDHNFAIKMESLNDAMAMNDLPSKMRERAREYMGEARATTQRLAGERIYLRLSRELRDELNCHNLKDFLDNVAWMPFDSGNPFKVRLFRERDRELHPLVLAQFAERVRLRFYAPLDAVNSSHHQPTLSYLKRGIVAGGTLLFQSGSVWGVDALLDSKKLWVYPLMLKAVSYSEVFELTKKALGNIRLAYPKECAWLRKIQVRMAVHRGFVLAAQQRCKRWKEALTYAEVRAVRSREGYRYPVLRPRTPSARFGDRSSELPMGRHITTRPLKTMDAIVDALDHGFAKLEERIIAIERKC